MCKFLEEKEGREIDVTSNMKIFNCLHLQRISWALRANTFNRPQLLIIPKFSFSLRTLGNDSDRESESAG